VNGLEGRSGSVLARFFTSKTILSISFFRVTKCEKVKAVIGVPAYFKEPQISATMEAAKLADIEYLLLCFLFLTRCRVLYLLKEPTAAAFLYKSHLFESGDKKKKVLVFGKNSSQYLVLTPKLDLGGGTLDITVNNHSHNIFSHFERF